MKYRVAWESVTDHKQGHFHEPYDTRAAADAQVAFTTDRYKDWPRLALRAWVVPLDEPEPAVSANKEPA